MRKGPNMGPCELIFINNNCNFVLDDTLFII